MPGRPANYLLNYLARFRIGHTLSDPNALIESLGSASLIESQNTITSRESRIPWRLFSIKSKQREIKLLFIETNITITYII